MYKFLTPSQEKWQHNSLVKNCILEQICQQWTWERHMLILQKKGKGGGLILAVRFIEWWIHKSCDSSWRQTRGLENITLCIYIKTNKTNPKSFPVRMHYHCPMRSYWLFQTNFILTWSWSEILNSYKSTWSWGTSSFQRRKKPTKTAKQLLKRHY